MISSIGRVFASGFLLAVSSALAIAVELNLSYTFNGSEATGPKRLFRDAVPSTSATSKSFPGDFGSGTYYFYTYTFVPRAGGEVTAKFTSTDVNGFLSLYAGSFDPTSLGTNYLGDVGSSQVDVPFSVIAPGGNVVLVLNSVSANTFSGMLYEFVLTYTPSVDALNTTTALWSNALNLRALMDRRLSGLARMASYDCSTFDSSGICLSFQARYTNFDSLNEGAGVFAAAYRLTDNVRLGSFIDLRANEMEPAGIKSSNSLPNFGVFVGYSQLLNGVGLQAKALAAVQKGGATFTRDNSLGGTEPGSGEANLDSFVMSGELGWGFAISPSMVATPFVGLRYTDVTRGSYNEAAVLGSVDYPISYHDYSLRLTTATVGVRLGGMVTDRIGYEIAVGLEHDLKQQTSAYSGTSSIAGLDPFALAVDGVKNRTRSSGSVGAFYQFDKNQRLTGNVSIRHQAYTSQAAVSVMGGYQIAF